jgi:hypothetical protein
MALLDDLFEGKNLLTTAVIGVGAAVLLPVLRPALKTAVKGGVIAYDWACRVAEETRHNIQDTAEEARGSIREARGGGGSRPKTASSTHETGSTAS